MNPIEKFREEVLEILKDHGFDEIWNRSLFTQIKSIGKAPKTSKMKIDVRKLVNSLEDFDI